MLDRVLAPDALDAGLAREFDLAALFRTVARECKSTIAWQLSQRRIVTSADGATLLSRLVRRVCRVLLLSPRSRASIRDSTPGARRDLQR